MEPKTPETPVNAQDKANAEILKGVKAAAQATPPGTPPAQAPETTPAAPAETPPVPEVPASTPPPADDPNAPTIPRARLNEVLSEKKALEEEIARLKNPVNPPNPVMPPINSQEQAINMLAEEMVNDAGKDEFETPRLTLEVAKAHIKMQLRLNAVSQSESIMERNINALVGKNANAAKYADRIRESLSKLPAGVKDNPENVMRKYHELRGQDLDQVEREAEQRGAKKAEEQKRIVAGAISPQPAGVGTVIAADGQLTDIEKKIARKMGVSEADYLARKKK